MWQFAFWFKDELVKKKNISQSRWPQCEQRGSPTEGSYRLGDYEKWR